MLKSIVNLNGLKSAMFGMASTAWKGAAVNVDSVNPVLFITPKFTAELFFFLIFQFQFDILLLDFWKYINFDTLLLYFWK